MGICHLIVRKACADIQPQLNELVATGVMSHATCLSMKTTVDAGLWLHFIGAIMLYVCNVAVREPARRMLSIYDSFESTQTKELTEKQTHYYTRRIKALVFFRLITYVHEDCGDEDEK